MLAVEVYRRHHIVTNTAIVVIGRGQVLVRLRTIVAAITLENLEQLKKTGSEKALSMIHSLH